MIDDKQIRWRCRRGMKELDALLERFLASDYLALADAEKQTLARLLDAKDPDLLDWLCGRNRPDDIELAAIVTRIRCSLSTPGWSDER